MRRIEAGIAGHQLRRQVEVLGLDRRVALGLAAERVEAGGEVAVGAVALEQRGRRLHRLQQLLVGLCGAAGARRRGAERRRRGGGGVGGGDRRRRRCRGRRRPPRRSRPRPAAAARCGAGRRPTRRPGSPGGRRSRSASSSSRRRAGAAARGGVRPLGRVGDRAGGDDRALALHQARHRGDGADPAGVGQRDVGALEVVGGELALARLGDQLLVVGVEAGEVERRRRP